MHICNLLETSQLEKLAILKKILTLVKSKIHAKSPQEITVNLQFFHLQFFLFFENLGT